MRERTTAATPQPVLVSTAYRFVLLFKNLEEVKRLDLGKKIPGRGMPLGLEAREPIDWV